MSGKIEMKMPSFEGCNDCDAPGGEMEHRLATWGHPGFKKNWEDWVSQPHGDYKTIFDAVWQDGYNPTGTTNDQRPVPSHFAEPSEEAGKWVAEECRRLFTMIGYEESEKGLSHPIMQIIFTLDCAISPNVKPIGSNSQITLNFGDWKFNDTDEASMKEFAEGQMKEYVQKWDNRTTQNPLKKLSTEYRGDNYDEDAPQWWKDQNGKVVW